MFRNFYVSYNKKLIFISTTAVLFLASCEKRGEVGGSHGDRDTQKETSLQQDVDVPPAVTDPMQIEEALKKNPESKFFGWSHLSSTEDTKAWGHIYFGYDKEQLQARVNISGANASQKYQVKLASEKCSKSVELIDSGVRNLGTVETDAQGRLYAYKVGFIKTTDNTSLEKYCSSDKLSARVFFRDKEVACGAVDCVKQNINSSH